MENQSSAQRAPSFTRPAGSRSRARVVAPSSGSDHHDPLHHYLGDIRHIPVLQATDEVDLAARMKSALCGAA